MKIYVPVVHLGEALALLLVGLHLRVKLLPKVLSTQVPKYPTCYRLSPDFGTGQARVLVQNLVPNYGVPLPYKGPHQRWPCREGVAIPTIPPPSCCLSPLSQTTSSSRIPPQPPTTPIQPRLCPPKRGTVCTPPTPHRLSRRFALLFAHPTSLLVTVVAFGLNLPLPPSNPPRTPVDPSRAHRRHHF